MVLQILNLVTCIGMVIVTKEYQKDSAPKLTPEQRREYLSLKLSIVDNIEAGLRHFETAGQMLARVRDARLYREEYETFASFVRDTLGKSRRFADYLINACHVMEGLRAY